MGSQIIHLKYDVVRAQGTRVLDEMKRFMRSIVPAIVFPLKLFRKAISTLRPANFSPAMSSLEEKNGDVRPASSAPQQQLLLSPVGSNQC